MKKLCSTLIVVSLFALSFAGTMSASDNNQQPTQAHKRKAEASQAAPRIESESPCMFIFTSGQNNTFLRYCITGSGNVVGIQTPVNQLHVFSREGYGICDINSNVEYFDYAVAGISSNWNAAVVLSQSARSVKIARTTSDGIWTLTQTFVQVPTIPSMKITMTLKNNTEVDREVQLSRFADIDADSKLDNTADATKNDAMVYNSVGRGGLFGLALQNIGTSPFTYLGFVQGPANGVPPCTPFVHQVIGPVVNIDGGAVMTYVIPIPAHASKTVTVGYRGL